MSKMFPEINPPELPPFPERPVGYLTTRDWFAGQALAGMLAQGFIPSSASGMRSGAPEWDYAKAAYILADDMLAARDHETVKTPESEENKG